MSSISPERQFSETSIPMSLGTIREHTYVGQNFTIECLSNLRCVEQIKCAAINKLPAAATNELPTELL